MEFLSPLNTDVWNPGYVFRGHGSVAYALAPVALRTSGPLSAQNVFGTRSNPQDRQVNYEVSLLQSFLDGCDAAGIPIVNDSTIREELRSIGRQGTIISSWPPESLWSLLATAQHHGVPTCLLDWSRRSYVAAYFAASTALRSNDDGDLAVWALNISDSSNWESLRYLRMPGATSQNLAAQDGVFTVSTLKATMGGGNGSTTLDQLSDIVSRASESNPILIKSILPKSEASSLLRLCSQFGVKGSTLFPGYEGVAREVTDQAYSGIDFQQRWMV